MRFILCLPFLFFAFIFTLKAQNGAPFPENSNEFVDKLGEFMTVSKRPDLEEAFSVFKKNVRDGKYREDELQRVRAIANVLSAQRLAAFPYFKNYINAVSASKTKSDTTTFDRWHKLTEQTLPSIERGRTKPIAQYLEFSADFLENNAFKTGEGGTVTWKVSGGKTAFEYREGQPILLCTNFDLVGLRKQDSVVVKKTSGIYYPYDGVFRGQSGTVSWAEAGLDSSVYCRLNSYKVETSKPIFSSDSSTLYYPLYFPKGPITGKFEHNIVVENKSAGVQYPRFESYNKTLKITKIGEGVEYTGGFKLWGTSLYGYGTSAEPAQMTLYNKKRERIFYGTSDLFIIKREVSIVAEGVDAKLYMDKDSLYHPAVGFRLEIPNQIIHLTRGQKGSERNPFYSSFYNMNLDAEKISWYITKDSIEIGSRAGGMKGVAETVAFESSNHYSNSDMVKMQNIASTNPISILYILTREMGSNTVSDDAFAQRLNPKFDHSSIQSLLAQMVKEGFINYHFSRHEIELRDKLVHYALASQGKKDFDAIKIESSSTSSNAKLDLKTKETTITEVNRIELSARQRVGLLPNERNLTLLQNRDMRFSGRLFAGFSLFQGENMHFSYDKFQVEFDSVKFLDFYLPTGEKDKNNNPEAFAMNSSVEFVSGVLLVDAPNNKSGKESLEIFPSLQTKKNSFVYYERPSIQAGAYKRDSFYFKLDPFAFNGLDSYTPDMLKFKGEMAPAGIFKPFKETIVVREEDRSFGFVHKTPPTGYPTYYGKGNYTGLLDLSNKGFLGEGKVEYLTADIESEDIVFKPRQMTATARRFFMEEDRKSAVKVPQARGEDVSVNWLPYNDSMYVTSQNKDFELFKDPGYFHNGTLILTPSGLKGNGQFEWENGTLTSKLISYDPFQASADTSDLKVKALDGEGIAFDSRNVNGELDFDKQEGRFKANTADASTTLPLNKYRTSMNEFFWDMKAQTITFKADLNKPAKFVSIDPDQDSLFFNGKTAFYDMKTSLLKIGGVEVIKSADAFIYTKDGNIEIEPGGKMTKFEDARIVADTVSKYHTIDSASVEILGKKLYKATGYYQYNIAGYDQEVFFDNIVGQRFGPGAAKVKNVRTTASGVIPEEQNFRLGIKTLYKGDIILNADKQNLRFEGYGKLDAAKLPANEWFTLRSDVDKNDPLVEIRKTKNPEDDPLVTGFFLGKESGQCYPRILLIPFNRTDRVLIDAAGFYKYDEKTDKFTFGDSLKVLDKSQRGAKMVYDNRVGTVQAEGKINIGEGLKYMKIQTAGKLKSDFNIDSTGYTTTGEFMSGINITMPKNLLDMMLNDIQASSFDAQAPIINTQMAFYQPATAEFVSNNKDMDETMGNLRNNFVVLPKDDNKHTILLGRHQVIWNDEYQSFLSLDDRNPVLYINGVAINKMLTVFVEYRMPTSDDDRFYIYIKPSPDLWYFLGYQAGALNVVSSSTRFNDAIVGMKPKDLQFKMPDGELYEIIPANPSLAEAFVNRVRQGRKKE